MATGLGQGCKNLERFCHRSEYIFYCGL